MASGTTSVAQDILVAPERTVPPGGRTAVSSSAPYVMRACWRTSVGLDISSRPVQAPPIARYKRPDRALADAQAKVGPV